jgi:hypothetical protein
MRRSLTALALAGVLGCGGLIRAAERPAGEAPPDPAPPRPALEDWERDVLSHIELLLDLEVVEDLDLLSQLDELWALSEGEKR